MKDINDHVKDGTLPDDPTVEAEPVSPKAKEAHADDARLMTVKQVMKASWDEVTAPRDKRPIITTTHYEIDRDTGGFCPEDVWIVAGKSQWGKTSFTIAVADENIARGHRILIVSGEDRPTLYGERLIIRRSRVNRYRYKNNLMNDAEFSRGLDAVGRAENLPVYLDARGKSVEWAAKRVRRIVAEEGIDLIFWDYLQCFHKDKPTQDQRLGITYIARIMTDVIKTSGKAGAILSQVTPDDKAMVPDMYSIRDSKDVANAAEVVAIGFVPKSAIERDVDGRKIMIANEGERAMVLAKNKPGPGPGGRIYRMGSDADHGCFDVVEDPDAPARRASDDAADHFAQSMPDFQTPFNESAER